MTDDQKKNIMVDYIKKLRTQSDGGGLCPYVLSPILQKEVDTGFLLSTFKVPFDILDDKSTITLYNDVMRQHVGAIQEGTVKAQTQTLSWRSLGSGRVIYLGWNARTTRTIDPG